MSNQSPLVPVPIDSSQIPVPSNGSLRSVMHMRTPGINAVERFYQRQPPFLQQFFCYNGSSVASRSQIAHGTSVIDLLDLDYTPFVDYSYPTLNQENIANHNEMSRIATKSLVQNGAAAEQSMYYGPHCDFNFPEAQPDCINHNNFQQIGNNIVFNQITDHVQNVKNVNSVNYSPQTFLGNRAPDFPTLILSNSNNILLKFEEYKSMTDTFKGFIIGTHVAPSGYLDMDIICNALQTWAESATDQFNTDQSISPDLLTVPRPVMHESTKFALIRLKQLYFSNIPIWVSELCKLKATNWNQVDGYGMLAGIFYSMSFKLYPSKNQISTFIKALAKGPLKNFNSKSLPDIDFVDRWLILVEDACRERIVEGKKNVWLSSHNDFFSVSQGLKVAWIYFCTLSIEDSPLKTRCSESMHVAQKYGSGLPEVRSAANSLRDVWRHHGNSTDGNSTSIQQHIVKMIDAQNFQQNFQSGYQAKGEGYKGKGKGKGKGICREWYVAGTCQKKDKGLCWYEHSEGDKKKATECPKENCTDFLCWHKHSKRGAGFECAKPTLARK